MNWHKVRRAVTVLVAAMVLGAPLASSQAATHKIRSANDRPNIVILLADDLGYGDLGVQGGKDVATPRIDRLAAEGVRLTDYYANHPVCAPSRAALMTGRYQERFGFDNNPSAQDRTDPAYGIPLTERMLPERLKARGYQTAMFGKWHIGFVPQKTPTARGFDTFYGFLDGAMAYTLDAPTGSKAMLRGTEPAPMPAHTTEAFGAEAVSFIEANKDKPFFVYLAFNAVHAPLQSTKAYIDRFSGERDSQRRTYLAMLAAMDDAVGAVVDAIDRNGLSQNTLIVFASDNGGPTWQTTSSNGRLNGVKALVLEGGVRVPAIFRWKGQLPAGRTTRSMAMGFDVTATALAAAGLPAESGLDGVDLRPFLKGTKSGNAHNELFWRSGGQAAARKGPWKMVSVDGSDYLFDLRSDIGEHKNLAAEQPSKLNELKADWLSWSNSMLRPQRPQTSMGAAELTRAAGIRNLVDGYVKGLAVDPRPFLYGGGPE